MTEVVKLKHFSHEEHLLILMKLCESKNQDTNIEKSLCHGCQTPISPSEPTYSCNSCSFFLHKTCAELPTYNFYHPTHSHHPLTLVKKPPYEGGKCKCHSCGRKSWSNFTYQCETCNFDMDIFCATLEGRKLEHPGHQHGLIPVRKHVEFECHACGETKEDALYTCSSGCLYWIHERCASLPAIKNRKDHEHPLSLTYFLSDEYIVYNLSCGVCGERLTVPYLWFYHCGLCRYVVHLKCVETEKGYSGGRLNRTEIGEGFLLLPTDDFAGDILETFNFQSGHMEEALGRFKSETSDLPNFVRRSLGYLENEIHGHSVIYFNVREDSNTRGKEIRCEACTDVIVSVCCKRVNHSNYFLHVTCALQSASSYFLKLRIGPLGWFDKLDLVLPENPLCFFQCYLCKLDCNGYYYRPNFYIDVKCALLPTYIYHDAHPHVLGAGNNYWSTFTCCVCGDPVSSFHLKCLFGCKNYHLCYECALLPKTTRHRWDKHPLILSFPPFCDHPERFCCEVCEEEIHPLHWQYCCHECDQSFHPRCIPQVSSQRNIKFGITVNVDEHPHILTLVREAGRYNPTCQTCKKSLYGHRAFECAPCKFYLCHDCVVQSKEKRVDNTSGP